jgi:hypothetical protein
MAQVARNLTDATDGFLRHARYLGEVWVGAEPAALGEPFGRLVDLDYQLGVPRKIAVLRREEALRAARALGDDEVALELGRRPLRSTAASGWRWPSTLPSASPLSSRAPRQSWPAPVRVVFRHIRWLAHDPHGAQDAPAQFDELRCLVLSAHQDSHGEIGAGYGEPLACQHLGVLARDSAALGCLPKETVREGHNAVTIASNFR